MSKPTTGERIMLGVAAGNERELRNLRTHPGCEVFRHKAAAINAAIAEAVKAEREACAAIADEQQLEGECPERASYIAAAIRARGTESPRTTGNQG